ncbi:MAG: transporter permease [Marmoricola sp.]|nr:transporter permease [Marmoricola sp.]
MHTSILDFTRDYGIRIFVLVGVIGSFLIMVPSTRGVASAYSLLEQLPFVGLVALGIAVTMIAGELDLSVASMAALMGVFAIMTAPYGLAAAIAVATIGGALLGAIQGFCIARLRINSLVFTIGTLALFRGLAYILSGGQPLILKDFVSADPLHLRWGIFSLSSVIAVSVVVVIGCHLAFTRSGRSIYAIGGARAEATAAGVPVKRSLTQAFAISGACAGLAGAIACLKGGSAAPEGFHDLLLLAAGAAMIGGIALSGGVGNVWNVLIGIAITGSLSVGMAAMAGPAYVSSLVLGILLILILSLDYFLDKAGRKQKLQRLVQAPV